MLNENMTIVTGNLTKAPEQKQLDSGTSVTLFRVANNTVYTHKGEKKERTLFIDVETWGKNAENCAKYLAKGSAVYVKGELRMDSWEDNDGKPKSKIKITADRVVFLDRKGDRTSEEASTSTEKASTETAETATDDDLFETKETAAV